MPPSKTARPRARAVPIIALLASLAAGTGLAACGGGGNTATDAAAKERASEHSDELKAANFAKCLREHGVQASASASGGGFQLRVSPSPGTGPQTMEAAQKACAKYQPAPKRVKLSPQERVKREEEVLKFAKCMREHGVDLHVEVGAGKVTMGFHGGQGGGPNPESPAFQAAQKACSGYLQLKPKGGFHAPGPGGHEGPSTKGAGGSGGAVRFGFGG
jgi:hypothetical protein